MHRIHFVAAPALRRFRLALCALALGVVLHCALAAPALAQCTPSPNTPINVTKTSETRQNSQLCVGQTKTFDEVDDVCVFIGNVLVAIDRTIIHVTEVGTKNCSTGCTPGPNTPIYVTEDRETRQNPQLCVGQTKTFDEVTDVPNCVANIAVSIDRFINHVTEIGTRDCSNVPINIFETSETRQNQNLCQGQTRKFDEVEDVPVFVGNILVSIDRFINHVTEVGTRDCSNVPINVTEISDTRQNPNLCQGQTRKFDEVSDFPIFVGNVLIAIERVITHVTEVGTKVCSTPCPPNPPVNVTHSNETRQNPQLCQGESKSFDEVSDFPITIGSCVIAIERVITHVTEVGTRECLQCNARLSPGLAAFPADGGAGSFDLVNDRNCRWTASTNADWLMLTSPTTGSGLATFSFTVKPHTGLQPRDAVINVLVEGSNLTFLVTQAGNALRATLTDPAACLGAGKQVGVTAWVSNLSATPRTASFTAALPPQLAGIPGSCSTTSGVCTISATIVTWSGTLASGQSVPISYQAQLAANTPNGATLVINNAASFTDGETVTLPYAFQVACPTPATAEAFCNTNSFAVPRLTRGLTRNDELFLLAQPLTLTIVSPQPGADSFAVNAQSFGALTRDSRAGFLNATTQGLRLTAASATTRAVSCLDSFQRISFVLASTGAPGDTVRLLVQDEQGANLRELAVFTVRADGRSLMVTRLHPEVALWLGNRLAEGAGLGVGAQLELLNAAGASGQRTGLLTLGLSGTLQNCAQLVTELSRADGAGAIALVLSDLVVNRQAQPNDASKQSVGLLLQARDGVPTGLPCRAACPVCPPRLRQADCVTACFASPGALALQLKHGQGINAPGQVWWMGRQIPLNQAEVLVQLLQDKPGVEWEFSRQYLAAQLSLARVNAFSLAGVRRSSLTCYGLNFAPVSLSSGVTLAPSSTLDELLNEAQRAAQFGDWTDAASLAVILEQLNRCER